MAEQSAKKKPKTQRTPLRKWTRRIVLLCSGLFIVGALTFGVAYAMVGIPDPNADFETETTNVFYSDGKTKIGTFQTHNRESISYDEMPESIRAAIIAAEDRTFYENNGIDIRGIVRAATRNATSESTQGASTITQQYVKVLYLTQERTYTRKLKEAIISLKIHRQLSKEEILEGYLNTIYFGNGAYGIQTAAQTYFRKPASELTLAESASLGAIINNPSAYDPYTEEGPERLLPRYQYVLDGLKATGAATTEEIAEVYDELPEFKEKRAGNRFGGWRGHLLRLTEVKLRELGFTDSQINGGGLRVVTTFNKQDQRSAVDAVEAIRPEGKDELNIGLAAVEPGNGALRAMYGGDDYIKSQLNWATLGTQPGSTMKVFAVQAALENGYGLRTRLNGATPFRFPNGDSVSNAGDSGGRSYGTLDLRAATRSSVNTAFMDLTEQMDDGPQKIWDAALEAGIPEPTLNEIPKVPVISLGFAPVAPVDMANAYATYAAEGKRAKWYVVEKVAEPGGTEAYVHENDVEQSVPQDVAADVTDALRGVVQGGTGSRGMTQCPTAGKTGTATFRKTPKSPSYPSAAYFVGYTPHLATAVSYTRGKHGNADLRTYLPSYYGGNYPAMTFSMFMRNATEGQDCIAFPPPANIKAEKGTDYTQPKPQPKPKPKPEPSKTKEPEPEPSDTPESEPSDTPESEPPGKSEPEPPGKSKPEPPGKSKLPARNGDGGK